MYNKKNCQWRQLEVVKSCFNENRLLWRRITRHARQRTVLGAPVSLREKIIGDTHGDMMTGHESANKTKEQVLASYSCPGMDSQLESQFQALTNLKKLAKTRDQLPHF